MITLLLAYNVGCSGDEATPGSADAAPAATTSVPAELVASSWQVRMAKTEVRAPFEGRPSWVSYFGNRRDEALRAFKSENDSAALARAHAEYAAMYRQAALLAANATLQVYGADRQPSDPAEADYLLGVSGSLTGNAAYAAKLGASGKSTAGDIARRDAAWGAYAAAPGAEAADKAAGLDGVVGALADLPGGDRVTLDLPLQGEPGTVAAGDPGELWALSRWHEARAREADPSAGETIDQALDPYRLPLEAMPERSSAPATDTWLFMSPWSSAADVQYVANVAAGRDTTGTMAASSLFAAVAQACTREGNKLDVDCVVDEAAHVGSAIEDAMAAANGGQPDGFHRPFADYARAGVLRALDLVARARGDSDASGRLRINALDRSLGAAADPLFYLFVAAWDAGNRNTPRAAEI
ncbi:MAG: hypothetical protein FJ102_26370, partial [Deltaproteobacteria bacterium]|nr:hypothetical protein [Deltaproteobacteria bacterium]